MPRTHGALTNAELVAVDADGLALDPDLRPTWGVGAKVTDAATRTRRGTVVALDGWTVSGRELGCPALWIRWADRDRPEHLSDLSGLLSRCGRRAQHDASLPIPAWEAVYARRRAARAALLDEPRPGPAGPGPGPVGRRTWLEAAPFRVTAERWSPDGDAYARGAISAAQIRCVLCGTAPCSCRPCPTCAWPVVAPSAACPRGCGADDA